MTLDTWLIFAVFWLVFALTPGPNAVNCLSTGMTLGFRRALPAVWAVLTQATLFLLMSAAGVTALLIAAPEVFGIVKLIGAGFLIYLGLRGWITARRPLRITEVAPRKVYLNALVIALANPKSVAGYLAAFSQFIEPGVPVRDQMGAILPTALTLTGLIYAGYAALGAGLGRAAFARTVNTLLRRALAACFIVYGVALGLAPTPQAKG